MLLDAQRSLSVEELEAGVSKYGPPAANGSVENDAYTLMLDGLVVLSTDKRKLKLSDAGEELLRELESYSKESYSKQLD
jgi:hypothetical protein